MFKVKGGKSKAHFSLPEDAPGGLYKLKAYTKWMSNFGTKMVFEKKLQVQKIIKPKILSVLDFAKEAYGAKDTVSARLNIRDLGNTPISNQELNFTVSLKGNLYQRGKSVTNDNGDANITFVLPEKLNSADGVLNVIFSHRGRNESISGAIPIVLNKIDLQFMPEGGDAIEMLPCKMAFKALNEFGKPADVEGEIYDSKGKLITTFNSFHQGMGAFSFVPDSNQVYKAKILKPSGISRVYELPEVKAQGCALHLKGQKDKTYDFEIYSNIKEKIYVVVQLRGEILYSKAMDLTPGTHSLPVLLDDTNRSGIAQITIFNDYERPVAERLFYVFQDNKLNIEIKTDKQTYAPREKVEMDLSVTGPDGNPVEGSFSLAVVDDKIITFADDKQDNIVSNLMLSSDLQGEIYEPSFYFDPKEEKAPEAIDYLLLTQGWRRFNWPDVLQMKKMNLQQAERYDLILGQITNWKGEGVKSKVVVIDAENKKMVKLETGEGGRFSISNLDDYKVLWVFARPVDRRIKSIKINISQAAANVSQDTYGSNIDFGKVSVDPLISETRKVNNSISMKKEEIASADKNQTPMQVGNNGFMMQEDEVALEEVVTIGYGTQRKSSVVGAITFVSSDELISRSADVNEALQGRVAGLQIVNNSGAPGTNSTVTIRGTSSLSSNDKPLYVVDGVMVTDIAHVSPHDIKNISVLKGAESTAVYGSRGANGVILISTKDGDYYNYQRNRRYARKMTQSYIYNAYVFDVVKEFYVPEYGRKEFLHEEQDMRETIYWNPNIVTNSKGKASVSFYNSDEVTTFRGIVEGIGKNGLVGRTEVFYNTQKPLTVEAKIPPYVVYEDVLEIPVLITNNNTRDIDGFFEIELPESWQFITPPESQVHIASNGYKEVTLHIKVGAEVGKKELSISFGNEKNKAKQKYETEVVSKGFPAEISYSARALESTFSFDMSKAVNHSTQMSISIYNNILAEIMDGIESVIRQPHGCFEQASASTYPNILILKYLQQNEEVSDALKEKALKYIKAGYKKLAGYETKQHGFEWFGHTPPHEGLTAFGLMEFHEMKDVYPGVSEDLLKRTREWLLSRKDGKGGFKTNKGKYGFSGASDEVTFAYLVYAFSESGVGVANYEKELDKAWNEALKSKDAYRMALMANACLNINDKEKAQPIIDYLVERIDKGGVEKLKASHSIVRSWGKSLNVEVAALTAMALMKNGEEYFKELLTLMDYIFGARSYGGFGSTQATVLSLKAITQYASIINRFPEDGTVHLTINDKELMTRKISGNDKLVKLDSLEQYLSDGVQTISLKFEGIRNPVSFSANANWRQLVPASKDECKVRIQTQLMQNKCEVNDLVRLSTRLVNKSYNGLPMTVAMVGIPSGLSAQPWQLKKMQEEHEFDYYEIHKNYVVFYFTELAPNARKIIHLDLKAEVPGEYSSPASCAYLYYTKEFKDWHMAGNIEIKNKVSEKKK
ncbi:TonB-dependent receptor plug domain-containing protein [Plebeiibacterium sediminum]|uniref:TonB-dependent receptor plug domain-containing protein n=1 Tax=Plebeiibacterium sediminum TaxID=2992112 RepID=A0AAE3M517_9BACT|nr:TonB-dependent receptor plug domain-containing protein [Plebeiobacterium sediminum]MCW3787391.1 TonB-dependent receptor plug domain-containing protein [Plebeiobacterium sediminum]